MAILISGYAAQVEEALTVSSFCCWESVSECAILGCRVMVQVRVEKQVKRSGNGPVITR